MASQVRLLRMFAAWGGSVCPYGTQAQAQPFPWDKAFPGSGVPQVARCAQAFHPQQPRNNRTVIGIAHNMKVFLLSWLPQRNLLINLPIAMMSKMTHPYFCSCFIARFLVLDGLSEVTDLRRFFVSTDLSQPNRVPRSYTAFQCINEPWKGWLWFLIRFP